MKQRGTLSEIFATMPHANHSEQIPENPFGTELGLERIN